MRKEFVEYIAKSGKKKVLFLTTSNRWEGDKELPKSTQLAYDIAKELEELELSVNVIETPKLKIFPCEGNISRMEGNNCGVKGSTLKDEKKNPSGYHRCWASINNKEDELWKVSKELFESDFVIFFISVRWGQTNSFYQKLIERLSWIENRMATLGEDNIVGNIETGCVVIGQNWNSKEVMETQKKVLEFYGFKVPNEISFNWQFTQDVLDETPESYKKAPEAFEDAFSMLLQKIKESLSVGIKKLKRLLDF